MSAGQRISPNTAAHCLGLSEVDSRAALGVIQHGKRRRFSMAAALQVRNDYSGNDLR